MHIRFSMRTVLGLALLCFFLAYGVYYYGRAEKYSLYKDIRDAEHYTWLVNEAERQCFQQMGTLFLCEKQQSAALLLALPSRKLSRTIRVRFVIGKISPEKRNTLPGPVAGKGAWLFRTV